MRQGIRSRITGLLKASHFGPTLIVLTITFLLSLTQFSVPESSLIAIAIMLGQFVVGWTNDLIDFPLDKSAMRFNKPLVAGTITEATLKVGIIFALFSSLIVSLLSPLGATGTAIHFLGLLSATAYNLKLKSTKLSVVPYVVSFGALPWAVYKAAETPTPAWLVFGFILIASAFHFLNVLKDLELDISQNILGLPQILGRQRSIATALLLAFLGILDVAIGISQGWLT